MTMQEACIQNVPDHWTGRTDLGIPKNNFNYLSRLWYRHHLISKENTKLHSEIIKYSIRGKKYSYFYPLRQCWFLLLNVNADDNFDPFEKVKKYQYDLVEYENNVYYSSHPDAPNQYTKPEEPDVIIVCIDQLMYEIFTDSDAITIRDAYLQDVLDHPYFIEKFHHFKIYEIIERRVDILFENALN